MTFEARHDNATEAAQAAEALRLGKRTQLNREYENYREDPTKVELDILRLVVARDYGDGVVEVGYTTVPQSGEIVRPEKPEPENETLDFDTQKDRARRDANLGRSVRRSKAQVRRKCMAANLNYMLTLDYRENMRDIDKGWADFKRFIRLVRKTHKTFLYCAVPEFQKRGAVHFHLAVHGWQNVNLLRQLWRSVVGEGNIDVKRPSHKKRGVWSKVSLALYLTKYITKEFASAAGRQRYRVSEGIKIPEHRVLIKSPKGRDIVQEVMDSLGSVLGFRWDGENYAHGWACSWAYHNKPREALCL